MKPELAFTIGALGAALGGGASVQLQIQLAVPRVSGGRLWTSIAGKRSPTSIWRTRASGKPSSRGCFPTFHVGLPAVTVAEGHEQVVMELFLLKIGPGADHLSRRGMEL